MSASLVLLDLQQGILRSGIISFDDPQRVDGMIGAASRLLEAARSAGAIVVHVGVARPRQRGMFDEKRSANALKSGKAPRDILPLEQGSPETSFVLEPAPSEEVVYKSGVSAFQGTSLDALLRNAGVRDVVVGGAFTHMVVESTVRQGFDIGYRMHVVEGACCSPAIEPHRSSLAVGIPNFATVIDVEAASEIFRRG
jgi:nicotinamidase-related amidase